MDDIIHKLDRLIAQRDRLWEQRDALLKALEETLEVARVAAGFIAEQGATPQFLDLLKHIPDGFGVRAQAAIRLAKGE